MIVAQNTLLNQYVPVFFITNILDGQGLIYDSTRKAFINADIGGESGDVKRLGELLDVSPNVDNPLSLQNGQALVYNSFTNLWENTFVDYNTLINIPTPTPIVEPLNQVVLGSGTGVTSDPELTFNPVTAILTVGSIQPGLITSGSGQNLNIASDTSLTFKTNNFSRLIIGTDGTFTIDGLVGNVGQVLTSNGIGFSPSWEDTGAGVSSVSAIGNNGISVSGSPITTIGTLTFGLGAITPTSVAATGTVGGSNLSGINTGDQTITLTGDVTGTGMGSFATTLATVNLSTGTWGSATQVPQFTVDAKGRITAVSNVTITGGGGVSAPVNEIVYGTGASVTSDPTLTYDSGIGTLSVGSSAAALITANVGQTMQINSDVSITLTTNSTDRLIINTNGSFSVNATAGTSGQVLTSNGTGSTPTWQTPSALSMAPEIVVFNYSAGGAGNFTAVDALYSQTSGVATTISDGPNCIAVYAFTGKSNPPKSITTYGQSFTTNIFAIRDVTSLPSPTVAGGGLSTSPDIANGIFTNSNIVTLQTRISDTGAAAGVGQRAWLVVVFGF